MDHPAKQASQASERVNEVRVKKSKSAKHIKALCRFKDFTISLWLVFLFLLLLRLPLSAPSIAAIYIWLVLLFLEEHSKMDFDSSLCAILNWQTIGAVICFVQIELDKKDSQTDGEKMNKE